MDNESSMSTTVESDGKILSEDIKSRIELNRKKAIELRQQKERELQQRIPDCIPIDVENRRDPCDVTSTKASENCQQLLADEEVCGMELMTSDIESHWYALGEKCCANCRSLNPSDFELINKDTVRKDYLLPVDSIGFLRSIEKPNPKNPGWTPMKLYLRKHAREKAFKRWGGREEIQTELEKRSKMKFERDLKASSSFFDTAAIHPPDVETKVECELSSTIADSKKRKVVDSKLAAKKQQKKTNLAAAIAILKSNRFE